MSATLAEVEEAMKKTASAASTVPQFPILSRRVFDLGKARDPYEFSLEVEHYDHHTNSESGDESFLREWNESGSFTILDGGADHVFDVKASTHDEEVGKLRITIAGGTSGKPIVVKAEEIGTGSDTQQPADDGSTPEISPITQLAAAVMTANVKVRFSDGHTLIGSQLFQTGFRDIPFTGWDWGDFSGFAVEDEKPYRRRPCTQLLKCTAPSTCSTSPCGKGPKEFDLNLTGHGKNDSLFTWVQRNWEKGLLICDDGSGEIADFVHVGAGDNPKLTLIHVKGALSCSKRRGISLDAFEVVVSQAVKNLRHLDRDLLAQRLAHNQDGRIGHLVWPLGGRKKRAANTRYKGGRAAAMPLVQKLKSNGELEVVIVQPHILKSAKQSAEQNPHSEEFKRLNQLNMLLLEAENACRGLNATLRVVADKE
ncbi:hypothetical protein ACI1US_00330 [Leucobacter sp. BZR 635]